jgi:phage baseplate assembly protein W
MTEQSIASFIGQGIHFPMRTGYHGGLDIARGVDSIERSIHMILSTAPGERVMRPDFGCAIWDLLYEPINTATIGLMGEATREALGRWEPRIEVDDVDVEPDDSSIGAVRISVAYTVQATNDHRNLVFPFYAIPGEDGDDINDQLDGQ